MDMDAIAESFFSELDKIANAASALFGEKDTDDAPPVYMEDGQPTKRKPKVKKEIGAYVPNQEAEIRPHHFMETPQDMSKRSSVRFSQAWRKHAAALMPSKMKTMKLKNIKPKAAPAPSVTQKSAPKAGARTKPLTSNLDQLQSGQVSQITAS